MVCFFLFVSAFATEQELEIEFRGALKISICWELRFLLKYVKKVVFGRVVRAFSVFTGKLLIFLVLYPDVPGTETSRQPPDPPFGCHVYSASMAGLQGTEVV